MTYKAFLNKIKPSVSKHDKTRHLPLQSSHTVSGFKGRHGGFLLRLCLAAFLVSIPLLKEPYSAGHDTKFHIANILSIENQIFEGQIPTSPIADRIGYGLGYGTRLFYPPLAHTVTAYVSAFLSFFGFTVTDSLKLVHFLMLSFSGITMYFLAFRLTKNRRSGKPFS